MSLVESYSLIEYVPSAPPSPKVSIGFSATLLAMLCRPFCRVWTNGAPLSSSGGGVLWHGSTSSSLYLRSLPLASRRLKLCLKGRGIMPTSSRESPPTERREETKKLIALRKLLSMLLLKALMLTFIGQEAQLIGIQLKPKWCTRQRRRVVPDGFTLNMV